MVSRNFIFSLTFNKINNLLQTSKCKHNNYKNLVVNLELFLQIKCPINNEFILLNLYTHYFYSHDSSVISHESVVSGKFFPSFANIFFT